jgi:hypothetical protein
MSMQNVSEKNDKLKNRIYAWNKAQKMVLKSFGVKKYQELEEAFSEEEKKIFLEISTIRNKTLKNKMCKLMKKNQIDLITSSCTNCVFMARCDYAFDSRCVDGDCIKDHEEEN